MTPKGKLYLLPVPLGEGGEMVIPPYVSERVCNLGHFIAERAKTARHYIKASGTTIPIRELTIHELNKFTTDPEKSNFLNAAEEGKDIGLLSEAGCPGVADPGAEIVAMAHQKGIEVIPMVGPSSILLALMGSGMNGQSFCFQGYLPAKRPELAAALKRLEQQSARQGQTILFIETPYRNEGLIEQALATLQPSTRFCIAAELTLPGQFIKTQTIKAWRKDKIPNLHKRPALFLLESPRK